MKRVAIIDYGVGNLLSLKRAFDFLNIDSVISCEENKIMKSSHLILPGVGAFGTAIRLLKDSKLDIVIKKFAKEEKPILGICLGMQLLFNYSDEFGFNEGLGLIKGEVKKILIKNINTPIIGWYKLLENKKSFLSKFNNQYVYLTHSFEVKTEEENVISKYLVNNIAINCAVKNKNFFGFQFHPEKSSFKGLKILQEFTNIK
jgi:glutamine amidotransferase